jgi:hypothetical protein
MTKEQNSPPAKDIDDDEDNSLYERVQDDGEEVAYCVWNGGAPGYSGSTRLYAYEGKFYIFNDGEFHGPYSSKDEAESHWEVFHSVDEDSEEDSAIVEVWDKDYGLIYQRKSLVPLGQYDERNGSLWVIDNHFVSEPWVGGKQLGELPKFDTKGARLLHLTQEEFDDLMENSRQ